MKSFKQAIQLDEDNEISAKESQFLESILKLSSVTSVEAPQVFEIDSAIKHANDDISFFCRKMHAGIIANLLENDYDTGIPKDADEYAKIARGFGGGRVFHMIPEDETLPNLEYFFWFVENELFLYAFWPRDGIKKPLPQKGD